ncbi:hypothetical protein, partial [Paenibacillus phoenicis]|uniref:hypothetical protein n=1 Tax=Paenibacillus phoenicis TaxID=554117 RepID=UPI0039EE34B6
AKQRRKSTADDPVVLFLCLTCACPELETCKSTVFFGEISIFWLKPAKVHLFFRDLGQWSKSAQKACTFAGFLGKTATPPQNNCIFAGIAWRGRACVLKPRRTLTLKQMNTTGITVVLSSVLSYNRIMA